MKESDEEDKEKGKEEEPCICCHCMSQKTYNLYIKAKEKAKDKERGNDKETGQRAQGRQGAQEVMQVMAQQDRSPASAGNCLPHRTCDGGLSRTRTTYVPQTSTTPCFYQMR